MIGSKKTIEIKSERPIPAPLGEVFDAWLNPKIPGTPWNAADKLLFNPEVDGFFYWLIQGAPHYGRFTEVERPGRIQHTWMSRSTLGEESMVTRTVRQDGFNGLEVPARLHAEGWERVLGWLDSYANDC